MEKLLALVYEEFRKLAAAKLGMEKQGQTLQSRCRSAFRRSRWTSADFVNCPAKPVHRECLHIREQAQSDSRFASSTKTLFGWSLLSQQMYAEAEPLLLAAPRPPARGYPVSHRPLHRLGQTRRSRQMAGGT